MKNYIPRSKHDMNAVENLRTRTFESVRADVPELLEWLQDMNWPVAYGVAMYLAPYVNEIEDELLRILSGDDGMWKYWLICSLIGRSSPPVSSKIVASIKRIADYPTKFEQEDEVMK